MPILESARHERYAQGLAEGLTQTAAHKRAGFTGQKDEASRLARDPRLKARVTELLAEGARAASVTPQWIAERLKATVDGAIAIEDYGAANATLKTLAQIAGELGDDEGRKAIKAELRIVDDTAAAEARRRLRGGKA